MADIDTLVYPPIKEMVAYTPGKTIAELKRELQLEHVIKLASNEHPYPLPRAVQERLTKALPDLARYPEDQAPLLKAALAKHHQLTPDYFIAGAGSSENIELAIRCFSSPGDEIIIPQYAFLLYRVIAQSLGLRITETPAKAYGNDLERITHAMTDKTRIVCLANPNNPTGTWISAHELNQFIQTLPAHVIVIVDEAYFEYLSDDRYQSMVHWVTEQPRVIITRTFSKIYGLGDLRLGYSIAHPDTTAYMARLRKPFNISGIAALCGQEMLSLPHYIEHARAQNEKGLQQLAQGFDALGIDYLKPAGNFITAMFANAADLNERLLHHGIIVRPIANYGLPNCLRISVGTPEENQRLLKTLSMLLSTDPLE